MLNPHPPAVQASGSIMPFAQAAAAARGGAPARRVVPLTVRMRPHQLVALLLPSNADGAETRSTSYLHPRTGAPPGRRDGSVHGLDRRSLVRTLYNLHAELLIREGR